MSSCRSLHGGAKFASMVAPTILLHGDAKLASRVAPSPHLHGTAKLASRAEHGKRYQCQTLALTLARLLHKTVLQIEAVIAVAEAQLWRSLQSLALKALAMHPPPLLDVEQDPSPMMQRLQVLAPAPVLAAVVEAVPQPVALAGVDRWAAPLAVWPRSLLALWQGGQVWHDHTFHKH